MFIQWGFTGYLALLVTISICLVPIETGVMLLWGRRVTGKWSLSAPIGYRQRGTVFDYAVLPLLLFICWGVLSIGVAPSSRSSETQLSVWLPAWSTQASLINGLLSSSPTQRSIALGLAVLLSGLVAPVVEEMYFQLVLFQEWSGGDGRLLSSMRCYLLYITSTSRECAGYSSSICPSRVRCYAQEELANRSRVPQFHQSMGGVSFGCVNHVGRFNNPLEPTLISGRHSG